MIISRLLRFSGEISPNRFSATVCARYTILFEMPKNLAPNTLQGLHGVESGISLSAAYRFLFCHDFLGAVGLFLNQKRFRVKMQRSYCRRVGHVPVFGNGELDGRSLLLKHDYHVQTVKVILDDGRDFLDAA